MGITDNKDTCTSIKSTILEDIYNQLEMFTLPYYQSYIVF